MARKQTQTSQNDEGVEKKNDSLSLTKLALAALYPEKGERPKYEPDDVEKKRWERASEEWQVCINFRSDEDAKFQEYIERYEARPFFYEDGRSGVVVPLGKAIIETAQAQESKNPPSFAYSPAEYEEDAAKAKILETVVTKHVWYQKFVNLDYKLDVMNQDKMILGTMYQYVGYAKMYRQNGDKKELFYDDLTVENVYPQDLWLHPLASCVDESPYLFRRKRQDYRTWLEEHSDFEMWKNVEKVIPGGWVGSTEHGGHTRKRSLYNEKDQVVTLEKWDKMTNTITVWSNGVEIKHGKSPFAHGELPFTDFRNRLRHNTYLGESEMERIATLSDSVNAFLNLAIDKEKRAASGINLLDNDMSDFDETANIFDPNIATRVNDPTKSFVHYDMPGMATSTDRIVEMLLDFLVFSTGIDFRQITDLSSSTKATVAALRREISQQRIQLNVGRNENCGMKRLGWLLGKCVQQFYPLPKVEYIGGVNPETDDEESLKKKSKISYRPIRVENMQVEEDEREGGGYDEGSLKIKGYKDGAVSFFRARPEYLVMKGDLCVRTIPGSTLAAIQELQKTKAKEYLDVATTIKTAPASPEEMPKEILSVKYGLEQYVKAMGYDVQRAFDTANKQMETPAQDEGSDIITQMNEVLGGNVKQPTKQGGTIVDKGMGGPAPKPAGPAPLTGVGSEPMKELADELGTNNRVTNKPV